MGSQRPSPPRTRLYGLVAVDFDQALVADPEVVGDLMEADPSHLPPKPLRILSIETHDQALQLRGDTVGVTFPGESPEYRATREQLLEREIELRRAMEAVCVSGVGSLSSGQGTPLKPLQRPRASRPRTHPRARLPGLAQAEDLYAEG
jgi:hypothetical protein